MITQSDCTRGLCNLVGILLLLSMASPANALEPWQRFEPNRPDWVEAGSSPRAKFFIDQNEMQIDSAVVWAFEQAVYTPGVKFFNPDKVIPDPKYSGPIKRAVFLLEFLCEHNTYREVNTTYWYENGETWDSGYPNLLAHGQIDIDNPIFQYMANFACAKRKAAATTAVPTIAAPAPPASASAVPPPNVPNVLPPSQEQKPSAATVLQSPVAAQPEIVAAQIRNATAVGTVCNSFYPSTSQSHGDEGAVTLLFLVTEQSRVTRVLVDQSSGFPALDVAAAACLTANAQFAPSVRNGAPIAGWQRLKFTWKLPSGAR